METENTFNDDDYIITYLNIWKPAHTEDWPIKKDQNTNSSCDMCVYLQESILQHNSSISLAATLLHLGF